MKNPPQPFSPELFESIDLGALAAELVAQARDEADGKAARTLFKSAELTVVVTALRADARLVEHAAPGPLLVVPLSGTVTFTGGAEGSSATVEGRSALALGPGRRHGVHATTDAAFLLVFGSRP